MLAAAALAVAQTGVEHLSLPSAADLLNESYLTGAQLVPLNRLHLLLSLASAAANISPGLSVKWAEELFQSSSAIPKSWERGMLQKNALQILSRADPTRAFGMVDQMDEPVPLDREIPEDLRAFVTQFIYPSCWAAKPSAARLESIRRQARALSADGQYPVQGILPVFEYLSQRDPAGAQGWWSEIVDWYARDRGAIQDTDRVFVTFLKAAWNDVGPAERRHALETAAKRLARQPESPPPSDRPVYRAKADTTAGQFVLTAPGYTLLLVLLPLIRETAPAILNDLAEKEAVFSKAKSPDFAVLSIKDFWVYPSNGGSGATQAAVGRIAAEREVMDQVAGLVKTDPAGALSLAVQLDRLRDQALSSLDAGLPDSKPEDASAVAKEAARQLKTLDNKELRLRLLVLQAGAARGANDPRAEAALSEGFDLGEDLFEEYVQSHPTAVIDPDLAPPLAWLAKLVRIGMRVSPPNTLGKCAALVVRPSAHGCSSKRHASVRMLPSAAELSRFIGSRETAI